jgi:hypothetical protein
MVLLVLSLDSCTTPYGHIIAFGLLDLAQVRLQQAQLQQEHEPLRVERQV